MSDIDVWSLVQQGLFEEACSIADIKFQNTNREFHLRNKIYALFHLGKYSEAIGLSEKIIKLTNGDSENDLTFLGIANWILGNKMEAIETWQRARNCLYKDAAGGLNIEVYLYFAAVKTEQDKLKLNVERKIKKLLKSKRSINWPGALGHYLLDDITETELLFSITGVSILRERQLCEAHFVLAIKRLEASDSDGYYKELKDCISYGPSSYLEQMYYLAKGELD
jgi:tetratricopeptide (TPR) repeat protein